MKQRFNRIRWWLWLIVGWVFSAVLCAELLGYPHVFGWPLWIVRVEGAPPPRIWMILADVLTALLTVAATTLVAIWCSRSPSGRLQSRLSTLMGLVAVIALLFGAERANAYLSNNFSFGESSLDHPFTFFLVDLTCQFGWRPISIRGPLSLFIRLGVVIGLACLIYSTCWCAVHIAVKRLMKRKANSPR